MKKQISTIAFIVLLGTSAFAQWFEKAVTYDEINYKRHYSHNIEGGTVDGIQREFITGNLSDKLTFNQEIAGQSVVGNTIGQGKKALLDSRMALADFAVFPSTENQYAVGTGIYYLPGSTTGYPFMGIYDRKTMNLLGLYYYTLSYPVDKEDKNSVGLRIKYSERNNSVYISGILCENILPEMNMHDLVGRSQGFILKINFTDPSTAQALVFNPDDISLIPLLCAVTDMEINADEQEIAFTGINTKSGTTGFYSPFAGKIDMNLNLLWSNTYSFGSDRFSGVDVEYSDNGNFFMSMNTDKTDFAIMEIGNLGQVIQQPVKYTFRMGNDPNVDPSPARTHILHYSKGKIYATGNLFEKELNQYLYSYEIGNASNLLSGDILFKSYADYSIPLGKHVEVTNYWAPENSVLSNDNLSIVGIYHDYSIDEFGFSLIHTTGYDTTCLKHGMVEMTADVSNSHTCTAHLVTCRSSNPSYALPNNLPYFTQKCPSLVEKSIKINDKKELHSDWQIEGIYETGIVLSFNNPDGSSYLINIYTASGKKVHSESISVKDQRTISLNFKTTDNIYLVNVNNGTTCETRKVAVVH